MPVVCVSVVCVPVVCVSVVCVSVVCVSVVCVPVVRLIVISGKIIEKIPGSVASGTRCILFCLTETRNHFFVF